VAAIEERRMTDEDTFHHTLDAAITRAATCPTHREPVTTEEEV
jgi:hypothetical protein